MVCIQVHVEAHIDKKFFFPHMNAFSLSSFISSFATFELETEEMHKMKTLSFLVD